MGKLFDPSGRCRVPELIFLLPPQQEQPGPWEDFFGLSAARSLVSCARRRPVPILASAGAVIFVGAQKENRFCLPNTRFLLHEPRGGVGGSVSDIQLQAEQISIMRERFHRIFANATGQTEKKIAKDMDRDFWLNTDEALDYGLLGKVISSADELA